MLNDDTAVIEHRRTLTRGSQFCAALGLLASLCLPLAADELPAPPPEQAAQYRAETPKTILELQQFRQGRSVDIEGAGGRRGRVTLIELNPRINAWFLLTLDWGDPAGRASFHIENPDPRGQRLSLVDGQPGGLLITDAGAATTCDPWSGEPSALERARASSLPYAPLCDSRLYLRNPVAGQRTDLERVTEFLRDHVWGGEEIVGFMREGLFRDAYLERGMPSQAAAPTRGASGRPQPGGDQ